MREITIAEAAAASLEWLTKGSVLLTSRADGKLNHMVIGWGTIGIEWGKPMCAVYVRESRFTRQLLDENPEFTVNIPVSDVDPEILQICGAKSGRDIDKTAESHLTPVDGITVSVPAVKELPITLECKVVWKQLQASSALAEPYKSRFYPNAKQPDDHIMYYGEITKAYIIE